MAHIVLLPDAPADPPATPTTPTTVEILGPEAHHAVRVKRLAVGDALELRDGRGLAASATITHVSKPGGEWRILAKVGSWRRVQPTVPQLRVLTGVPKGERLAELVDGLSQAGAASWAPLESGRAVVGPSQAKLERLSRVAREALKQCGRAWLLEIGAPIAFDAALGPGVIVADASGEPYARDGAEAITLLVGPEGGFDGGELERARGAGARVCRFGPHTMRIETAAVAAAAIIMGKSQ